MVYVRRQLKLVNPVLNFKIFKSRKYTIAAIIATLNFAMIMAAMYIIPQMLQSGLRFSVSEAGLILLPAGLVNAFVSLMAGHLYDSFGAKKTGSNRRITCVDRYFAIVACALKFITLVRHRGGYYFNGRVGTIAVTSTKLWTR